ncbi:uncharacterized protein UTRI_05225_B [Ustilago trichophora]|uniref:Uncharacterized protein n=1 Tax=Ustilago trichophora TaxID=86804 RepID=A0A5C3EM02_9BASI|nr:uncharacterized protein UTRI_05225_B [Ustilago trichophora]
MPFSPKAHAGLFVNSRRRKSLAQGEESETLSGGPLPSGSVAGLQPSASTSWINPFAPRASFSVEDDTYHPSGSLPSSRRPSAATIISTLLHGVGVGSGKDSAAVRLSQDGSGGGYTSGEDVASSGSSGNAAQALPSRAISATTAGHGHAKRPSAMFKAWKARRTSNSTPGAPSPFLASPVASNTGFAQGRRKSSALTRVLQTSLRNGSMTNFASSSNRLNEHTLSSSLPSEESDPRRRSLSIVCRGDRDSAEMERLPSLDQTPRHSSGVTAAMAIRDTWLYGAHQWTPDGRKGSVSTIATPPTYSSYAPPVGRKSISGPSASTVAVGLDEEDQRIQHQQLQERMRQLRRKGGASSASNNDIGVSGGLMADSVSVVSLSLTEEIALYTSDVQVVEKNAGKARRSANSSAGNASMTRGNSAKRGNGAFVGNLPDWGAPPTTQRIGMVGGMPRLPELSPAPAIMIADPFSRITTQSQGWGLNGLAEREEEGAKSASMQRVESGSLDPVLSPFPASSPGLAHTPTSDVAASDGHSSGQLAGGVQWSQPQWNAASPFRPDAPTLPPRSSHRPSLAATFNDDDQSPTAPNFPPPSPNEDVRRRDTTYYDASPLPIVDELPTSPTAEFRPATLPRTPRSPRSPKSPKSFGTSETNYEILARRRTSYSLPRPPPGYGSSSSIHSANDQDEESSEHMPTPRLVSTDFGETSSSSPLSSNFAPETPSNVAATFPEFGGDVTWKAHKRREMMVGEMAEEESEGDDLHEQFCSVLLLDLGNGTAIPLSPSPGPEPRPDPFALLAH